MDIFKLIGVSIIAVGVSAVYLANSPSDPLKDDKKIIESYNKACLIEAQLQLAESKKKECVIVFKDLTGTEFVNECNKFANRSALIGTYSSGEIYDSYKSDYLKYKQQGAMPLSNGKLYKEVCPKFDWIDVDTKDLDKILEKSLEKSS